MIHHLHGLLTSKQPPWLVIDVNGVGYEVQASQHSFVHLPDVEHPVKILIHMIVREDAHSLYGFHHESERQLFRLLIKVTGVGPKLALTLLSGINPQELIAAVQKNDVERLTHIPGVGKKTAQRIIMETRDHIAEWPWLPASEAPITPNNSGTQAIQDTISALTALGYKPQEVRHAIKAISNQSDHTEDLIRLALQQLAHGAKST